MERHEGGGREVYVDEHHLSMLKQEKKEKLELKILVCPQPAL